MAVVEVAARRAVLEEGRETVQAGMACSSNSNNKEAYKDKQKEREQAIKAVQHRPSSSYQARCQVHPRLPQRARLRSLLRIPTPTRPLHPSLDRRRRSRVLVVLRRRRLRSLTPVQAG